VITRWPVFERHRVFEELRHTERPFMQWNAALRSLRRQRLPTRLSCTMGENKSRAHLLPTESKVSSSLGPSFAMTGCSGFQPAQLTGENKLGLGGNEKPQLVSRFASRLHRFLF